MIEEDSINTRFTTVPLKPLSDQKGRRYRRLLKSV